MIMDDTIVKGLNILWGMDKGGVLVVNSKRSPDEILKFIPNKDLLSKVICVDAEEEFSMEGLDFMGSEGGVEAAAVGAGISAVLAGAACHGTDNLTIDSLVAVAANKAGAKAGYETAVVKEL